MSVRKRTVTIAVNAYGLGSDDTSVGVGVPSARWCGLFGVRVSSEDNSNRLNVDVRELDRDDDNVETDGAVIFHAYDPRPGVIYQPRIQSDMPDAAPGAKQPSSVTGEENALQPINSQNIRVDVSGATPSSTVVVDVFIESAGDQRF